MNIELELKKTKDPKKLQQLLRFYAKQRALLASSFRRSGDSEAAEAIEDETESTLSKYNTATAALPLSQFRKYRKDWDKSTWEKLFRNQADCDRNHFRCYVPLSASAPRVAPVELLRGISDCLRAGDLGTVEDLFENKAVDKHGRKTTVMKLLAKAPDPAASIMSSYQRWLSGSTRSREGLSVCFSRHPYDIAAMSTDRAWRSCFELTQGDNVEYLSYDVKDGAVVAYVIDSHDRNITNPLGRMTLRPYLAVDGNSLHLDTAPGRAHLILFPSGIVYGQSVPGFHEACVDWCKSNFKMHGTYHVRRYMEYRAVEDAADTQNPGYKKPQSSGLDFNFDGLDFDISDFADKSETTYEMYRRFRRSPSGDNPIAVNNEAIQEGHGFNTLVNFSGPVFGYIKFWAGAVESGRVPASNRHVQRALCAATLSQKFQATADFLASAGAKANIEDFLDRDAESIFHTHSSSDYTLPKRFLEYFPQEQLVECLQRAFKEADTRIVSGFTREILPAHLVCIVKELPRAVQESVLQKLPDHARRSYEYAVRQ